MLARRCRLQLRVIESAECGIVLYHETSKLSDCRIMNVMNVDCRLQGKRRLVMSGFKAAGQRVRPAGNGPRRSRRA